MFNLQVPITEMPGFVQKQKIRAALKKFSWVFSVRFEVVFDEPTIQIEHAQDPVEAVEAVRAKLQEVAPGLAVSG